MSKYNHDSNNVNEACGFTELEVENLWAKANKAEKEARSISELAEQYESNLSLKELAFFTAKLRLKLMEMRGEGRRTEGFDTPQEAISYMINRIKQIEAEAEKERTESVILTGIGGDA